LKARAKLEDLEEMRVFKLELREALRDPSQLPGDELSESVEYDNGSDEAFLYWLWRQLYGDEPAGTEAAIGARIDALPDRFTGRLDPQAVGGVCHAARAGECLSGPFGRNQGRWPCTGRATSGGRALPRSEQASCRGGMPAVARAIASLGRCR
jgi:hypothetical protein